MNTDIQAYNNALEKTDKEICNALSKEIDAILTKAESKIWHAIPVWFIDGNPIVGYGKLKNCVRLLFWSGQSFEEKVLQNEGSFKAAEIRYTSAEQIDTKVLQRCLKKAIKIQWDYKNLIKRKGKLEPLKGIQEQRTKQIPTAYGSIKFRSIDEYHSHCPAEVQKKLTQVRQSIQSAAPQAVEIISYNMPAFKMNSTLVYYAIHKEHIGFYPTSSPIKFFAEELKEFKHSKGAIQLPLNKAIPTALIKKIVKFRVEEVLAKEKKKK